MVVFLYMRLYVHMMAYQLFYFFFGNKTRVGQGSVIFPLILMKILYGFRCTSWKFSVYCMMSLNLTHIFDNYDSNTSFKYDEHVNQID